MVRNLEESIEVLPGDVELRSYAGEDLLRSEVRHLGDLGHRGLPVGGSRGYLLEPLGPGPLPGLLFSPGGGDLCFLLFGGGFSPEGAVLGLLLAVIDVGGEAEGLAGHADGIRVGLLVGLVVDVDGLDGLAVHPLGGAAHEHRAALPEDGAAPWLRGILPVVEVHLAEDRRLPLGGGLGPAGDLLHLEALPGRAEDRGEELPADLGIDVGLPLQGTALDLREGIGRDAAHPVVDSHVGILCLCVRLHGMISLRNVILTPCLQARPSSRFLRWNVAREQALESPRRARTTGKRCKGLLCVGFFEDENAAEDLRATFAKVDAGEPDGRDDKSKSLADIISEADIKVNDYSAEG